MELWSLVFAVVVSAFGLCWAKPPESLRMVHYLFRHGDRTPIHPYYGDPNPFNKTWPKGAGQLTTHGMQQHYKLGKYFRKRYDGFIDRIYYNRQVYVRSTDVDRTLMSAYSHLAGLYPPKNEDVWSESIPWQPIPVHTIPTEEDFILRCDNCSRQDVLHEKVFDLPYFKEVKKQYGDFMQWISYKFNDTYDLENTYQLADTIYIEHIKKLPIPDFVNASVIQKLRFLDMVNFKTMAYTTELQRITGGGGPLVKDIVDRIRQKIDRTLDPDLKLYIYSAHDSTVSGFLHALRNFNDQCPPYTATVIVELHEVDNQYFLEFSFKNETDHEPYNLTIPGCPFRCPFEKFVELTRPIISDNVKAECNSLSYGGSFGGDARKVQVVIFASIAGVSIMIVILQVAVIHLLSRRNRQHAYTRVDLST